MYKFQSHPVQLLNINENDGEIQFNQKAVNDLFMNPKLTDRKVVVVSIVGAFRKGKSFLLNYILRYLYANYESVSNANLMNPDDWLGDAKEPLTGFSWKSGTDRDTTGLVLWSDIFLFDKPNGEKIAIYLMDTQGLFGNTKTDDSRILSLSTLISSVQIFNLFNNIQEDQLEFLHLATELARHASETKNNSKTIQNLLILIRDWSNPEEQSFGVFGGNQYLNKLLEVNDHQKPELKSVRNYLGYAFESINCFLMPHPGKTVARDSKYDGNWEHMDEDFLKSMKELLPELLSPNKLKTKVVNGKVIKPAELLIFIKTYIEHFKSGKIPAAKSIYEATLVQQFPNLIAKNAEICKDANQQAELKNANDLKTDMKIDNNYESMNASFRKKYCPAETIKDVILLGSQAIVAGAARAVFTVPPTAHPVQLLNINENDGEIQFNQKAVNDLFMNPKLTDRKVVVVSIVGAFRKGKSFLLNYILRYLYANYESVSNANLMNPDDWLGDAKEPLTGFSWKSGTDLDTTGMIMWSDVFLHESEFGEKLAIVLMDTQGLFGNRTTKTDDSWIFSLSTLISSVQIFNLFNNIQEDQLEFLHYATELAIHASESKINSKSFQNLLILIRDWNNPEEHSCDFDGGNQYLKKLLEVNDHQNPELQYLKSLRSTFESINCFLMPHPGKTVARDSKYDGNWEQMDEDFLKSMKELLLELLSPNKLKTKVVNGKVIKPAELLIFIKAYIEHFKSGKIPAVQSKYEAAHPIGLINFKNGTEKLKLNLETLKTLFLDDLVADRNVVVISIVGAFRTGKSFLLNYLLRFMYANYRSTRNPNATFNKDENVKNWLGDEHESLKGFPWKSGKKKRTVCIKFWSDVFLFDDETKGQKIAIYLMDTEGLFEHGSLSAVNARLLSLSTFISSVQILNLLKSIHKNDLKYLKFATESAKLAGTGNIGKDGDSYQKLLFLIRDWNSPLDSEHGLDGGNKFLENFLKIRDFQITTELESIRQYVKSSFDEINCFLMPYPGKTVARTQYYDGRLSNIDENFVGLMEQLFHLLLHPANLKTLNKKPVKARELSSYIKCYFDSHKPNKFPVASSNNKDSISKDQFQYLEENCKDIYLKYFTANDDTIENMMELDKLHEISMFEVLKYLSKIESSLNHEGSKNSEKSKNITKFKEKLFKSLTELFEQRKNMFHYKIDQKHKNEQIQLKKAAEDKTTNAKREIEETSVKKEQYKSKLQRYNIIDKNYHGMTTDEEEQSSKKLKEDERGLEKVTRNDDSTSNIQFKILNYECKDIYSNSFEANQDTTTNLKTVDEVHKISMLEVLKYLKVFVESLNFQKSNEDFEIIREKICDNLINSFEERQNLLKIKQEELKRKAEDEKANANREIEKSLMNYEQYESKVQKNETLAKQNREMATDKEEHRSKKLKEDERGLEKVTRNDDSTSNDQFQNLEEICKDIYLKYFTNNQDTIENILELDKLHEISMVEVFKYLLKIESSEDSENSEKSKNITKLKEELLKSLTELFEQRKNMFHYKIDQKHKNEQIQLKKAAEDKTTNAKREIEETLMKKEQYKSKLQNNNTIIDKNYHGMTTDEEEQSFKMLKEDYRGLKKVTSNEDLISNDQFPYLEQNCKDIYLNYFAANEDTVETIMELDKLHKISMIEVLKYLLKIESSEDSENSEKSKNITKLKEELLKSLTELFEQRKNMFHYKIDQKHKNEQIQLKKAAEDKTTNAKREIEETSVKKEQYKSKLQRYNIIDKNYHGMTTDEEEQSSKKLKEDERGLEKVTRNDDSTSNIQFKILNYECKDIYSNSFEANQDTTTNLKTVDEVHKISMLEVLKYLKVFEESLNFQKSNEDFEIIREKICDNLINSFEERQNLLKIKQEELKRKAEDEKANANREIEKSLMNYEQYESKVQKNETLAKQNREMATDKEEHRSKKLKEDERGLEKVTRNDDSTSNDQFQNLEEICKDIYLKYFTNNQDTIENILELDKLHEISMVEVFKYLLKIESSEDSENSEKSKNITKLKEELLKSLTELFEQRKNMFHYKIDQKHKNEQIQLKKAAEDKTTNAKREIEETLMKKEQYKSKLQNNNTIIDKNYHGMTTDEEEQSFKMLKEDYRGLKKVTSNEDLISNDQFPYLEQNCKDIYLNYFAANEDTVETIMELDKLHKISMIEVLKYLLKIESSEDSENSEKSKNITKLKEELLKSLTELFEQRKNMFHYKIDQKHKNEQIQLKKAAEDKTTNAKREIEETDNETTTDEEEQSSNNIKKEDVKIIRVLKKINRTTTRFLTGKNN